tara:strand:- start:1242 stop:1484 length:243 start_codon:yes stop_codon:yes gene_type:complete
MPGYKNYTIKKYRGGGLVETKKYEDGKTVVTEDERMKAMQQFLNEDTSEEEVTVIIKDSKKNPNKYIDMMGVPIKKPKPK